MGNPCIKTIVCENLENKIKISMWGPLVDKGPPVHNPSQFMASNGSAHSLYIFFSARHRRLLLI